MGETRYGLGQPEDCAYGTQGYHCDPYQPLFLFYRPAELVQVVAGEREAWSVVPYATLDPQEHFWPSCGWALGGMAFDSERGLVYVVQAEAFEGQPLVHVSRLVDGQGIFANRFE